MSDKTAIKTRELRFAYNGAEIIRGIDLDVAQGAFHCLLGPNGSGKTTLVKLLSGVIQPVSGRIEVFGEPIEKLSAREVARKIAVAPQGARVAFSFTALEIVLMGRAPHLGGMSLEGKADLEIAREVMEMTATWEFRRRTMDQLSGGEAQRVIVARALAQKPRILILDEPTVYLDIKHQIELMELLMKLHADGDLTVLAVTHDLNIASRYAQRVTFLHDGKIYAEGAPEEALTPSNIFDVFEARVEVSLINGKPNVLPAGRTV